VIDDFTDGLGMVFGAIHDRRNITPSWQKNGLFFSVSPNSKLNTPLNITN
jgi:hypothetical protein